MVIVGIEGGIGTGKTVSVVWFMLEDLKKGKLIYTNIRMNVKKGLAGRIIYLTKDKIADIFEHIKKGRFDMKNSTVAIQEMHNYMDSRTSQSKRNRALSYWILQSRHTGEGSCDIIFDTQQISAVDIRLRRNIDYLIRPFIIRKRQGAPELIQLVMLSKQFHKWVTSTMQIDVTGCLKRYNTHEVVEF